MEHLYCEFENTGTKFKNKDIYKCIYCDIKLLLENPETARVICFAKRQQINKVIEPDLPDPIAGLTEENYAEHALEMALKNNNGEEELKLQVEQFKNATNLDNACSQEQINERLAICNTCEHYENNACLLCGCVVIREKNYNNKLAQKNQVCPAGKWGKIED